ncbi:MAG: tyrosine-type recombinase/integrase [Planctomycetales bacterium]|nr:tyrosine-type recombinase/integrase [Planctomycetales bacterium]
MFLLTPAIQSAKDKSPILSCHSFRATTATDLLDQGVPLEDVQYLLGHADPRTTRLSDRRHKEVTRNIVEQISV